MRRLEDNDYGPDLKDCWVSADYGADPEHRIYPSLSVTYKIRNSPSGLKDSIEWSKDVYQRDRPDRSIISNSLELSDDGMSWIEQGGDLEASAIVRDETLVINVSVKTKPGTTDPVALETLARKAAGIALESARR